MEILYGVGLLVILVLIYIPWGLGEDGTSCFLCREEKSEEDCRGCPLRRLRKKGGRGRG
jgi:hypothetical protein